MGAKGWNIILFLHSEEARHFLLLRDGRKKICRAKQIIVVMAKHILSALNRAFEKKHKSLFSNWNYFFQIERSRSFPTSQRDSFGGSPFHFNNNNQYDSATAYPGGHLSAITHRKTKPWPPPGEVERGLRAEELGPGKITKINGKEIDLVRTRR